jgi:hypothetical protein
MMRVPIWATAFALVAGGALAAPSLEAPIGDPQPVERPTLSEDSSWGEFVLTIDDVVAAEEIVVARKARGGGGKRGGAKGKNRGGFRAGDRKHAQRHVGEPGRPGRVGEPGRPGRVGDVDVRGRRDVDVRGGNVNIDRDVNVRGGGGWGGGGYYDDDDDDDFGEAVAGGIVGMGIGKLLFDDDQQ